ncbi:THUMP domain-containing protein, partial [Intestinimonas sp.]
MERLKLAVPTLFGLEGLTADELRRLGLEEVRADNGRVTALGTPADVARLNLNLRTGERVLIELGCFLAGDFDALFEGTRALPWEQFIPLNGAFPVKGHSLNSALHAIPACQSIVKKAVAARLGQKYGLETLPENGPVYQIQFSIMKDMATLMLDTSGAGLHKR